MYPTEFKIKDNERNIIIKLSETSKWSNANQIKKLVNDRERVSQFTLIEADPEKPDSRKKCHSVDVDGNTYDSDFIKIETKNKIITSDYVHKKKKCSSEIVDFVPILSFSIKKKDLYSWDTVMFPEIQCIE